MDAIVEMLHVLQIKYTSDYGQFYLLAHWWSRQQRIAGFRVQQHMTLTCQLCLTIHLSHMNSNTAINMQSK